MSTRIADDFEAIRLRLAELQRKRAEAQADAAMKTVFAGSPIPLTAEPSAEPPRTFQTIRVGPEEDGA